MPKIACPVMDLHVEKIDPGGCRLDPWRIVDTAGREVGYMAPYPTDSFGPLPPCWYPFAFPSRKTAQAKLRELQAAGSPQPGPAGGEEPGDAT